MAGESYTDPPQAPSGMGYVAVKGRTKFSKPIKEI